MPLKYFIKTYIPLLANEIGIDHVRLHQWTTFRPYSSLFEIDFQSPNWAFSLGWDIGLWGCVCG